MSVRSAVKRIIQKIPEDSDSVPIPEELSSCKSSGDSPKKQLTFKSLQNERDNFRQLSLKSRERDFSSSTLNKLKNFEHEWNSSRDLFHMKSCPSPLMKSLNLSSERTKIDSSKLLIEIANATSEALRKVKQFEERKEEPIDELKECNVRILDIWKVNSKKTLKSYEQQDSQGAKSFDFILKPSSASSKADLQPSSSITPYEFFLSKCTEENNLSDQKLVEEKTVDILSKNIEINDKRTNKRAMSDKELFGPRKKLGLHTPRIQATLVDLDPSSSLDSSENELLSNIPSNTPEIQERSAKSPKIKINTFLYNSVKNPTAPVLRRYMKESPHLSVKSTSPIKEAKSPFNSEEIRPKKRDPVLISQKCTKYKTLHVTLTKEPENTDQKQKVSLQISKEFALSIESTFISIPKEEPKPVIKEDSQIAHKPTRNSRRSPNLFPSKLNHNKKHAHIELNPSPVELNTTKELKEINEIQPKEDLIKRMPNLRAYTSKTTRTCTSDVFNDSGTDEKNSSSRKLNKRQQEDLISRLVGNSARRRLLLYK